MLVGMHSQHLLSDQLEAEQQFRLVGKEHLDVAAPELDRQVRILEIRIGISARFHCEVQLKPGIVDRPPQKTFNSRTCFFQRKSAAHAVLRPF